VPAAWAGRELVLMLGPIDDMDSVWFAGHKIGGAEEAGHWARPREYRIPGERVAGGTAVLSVRVLDTGGEGGIGGDAEGKRLFPASGEQGGIGLAGAWRFARGARLDALPAFDEPRRNDPNQPTALWNGMLAPLCGWPLRGAIWSGRVQPWRAEQYARLFPALIRDWRRAFGSELPFYFVQIAPFAYGNDQGESFRLRLAQTAALALPATGMATTTDVGEADDIHPRQKRPVGERLARLALRHAYGQRDVVADAPSVHAVVARGNALRVEFQGADGGLRCEPGGPRHLEVAGADGVFPAAVAAIDGASLLVQSDQVAMPLQVRYCHAAAAIGGLANAAGLPVGPFLELVRD
jgi:sialate O-acetylesterase